MNELADLIRNLNDTSAERILRTLAQQRLHKGQGELLQPSPELGQGLADASGIPASDLPVPSGDLARQCLLLLAETADTEQARGLRSLVENPPAERYADPITVMTVATAALVVLQSFVKVERDKEGKWTFKFEKRSVSDSLLKLLIQKLGGYLSGK